MCSMKYFLVAGEASGDLHAKHLMGAIRAMDAKADIRYWYRPDLTYMGFVSVAMHLPEILRGMRQCREEIRNFCPDRLVLVDYPGFNLKIAAWFRKNFGHGGEGSPKIVYYIPPKIWAWKEGRIAQIRRNVDAVLSILPFEVDWYARKYGYKVDYVGNPTLDEISAFRRTLSVHESEEWRKSLHLGGERLVALLPGSRRGEIERNLPMMLKAAEAVGGDFAYVVASAPNVESALYERILSGVKDENLRNRIALAPCQGSRSSFLLLHNAFSALVTSGTATLETAILGVPQVVCYAMGCGKVMSALRKLLLKVPYVSLVNLIVGREVVPELIAGDMTERRLEHNLRSVLTDNDFRENQLRGYEEMMSLLGDAGAPQKAAKMIVEGMEK